MKLDKVETIGEQIRILVIDDDPDILENVSESLRSPLFCAQTTDSSETFAALVDGFNADIVLADLKMPTHDGLDVLRILRDQKFEGGVVLMSGSDGQIIEAARRIAVSYGLSVAGILRKPFTQNELITLVTDSANGGGFGNERVTTALSERRIRPYYQPTIDLKTGAIVAAEALSRWYHAERGLLTPDKYPESKPTAGRQSLHDYTILERALEFAARLNGISRPIKIAVNFTADVILTDEFMQVVSDAQRRYGLAPEQLVVELTEHDTANTYEKLNECLLKLRLYGAHVALDDFGVGNSTLSCIQKLPISEIKLDRSFMIGFHESSRNVAVVRSIVELAHSVGILVVAKGVETVEAVELLQKIGCDMAQGYLFSPAVSDATFFALMRDENFSFLNAE